MKVTAALTPAQGEDFQIVDNLELDDLRPDEVRVRFVASGVCHTDAAMRDGVYPMQYPIVLGHEGAGIVEEVGSLVTSVEIGDHVVCACPSCGRCESCRAGDPMYCQHTGELAFGGYRLSDNSKAFSLDGQSVGSHFFGQSSFSTHSNVLESSVVKVDKDLPLEILSPLGCGLTTGAGTIMNEFKPQAGQSVAVMGSGAVGMAAIMAAAAMNASPVIAIDINDDRLALAKEMGATDSVNSSDMSTLVDQLMEITGGKGVDYILDTTGVSPLMTTAAQALARRGTLGAVAAASPGTEVSFEIGASLMKGWTFKTVIEGSCVPQTFIPELIQLWKNGRFPFDKMTKVYDLTNINEAFEASKRGEVIKPILRMPEA